MIPKSLLRSLNRNISGRSSITSWLSLEEVIKLQNNALAAAETIPGWLTNKEAIELFKLAITVRDAHPVCCEIGSWLGKSSVLLGTALLSKKGGKLYCVDLFDLLEDEPWYHQIYREQLGYTNISRKEVVMQNMKQNGLEDKVVLLEGFSHNVIKGFKQKIDLLFIDGDHSYEGVLQDFSKWSPLIRPGGVIAFHDYHAEEHEHDGPRRVVEEHIIHNSEWSNQRVVDTLFIATKRK